MQKLVASEVEMLDHAHFQILSLTYGEALHKYLSS